MSASQNIVIENGALAKSGDFFIVNGNLLIVTRGTAKERWLLQLIASLKEAGMLESQIQIFSNYDLNPKVQDMIDIASSFSMKYDAILAFGGGSSIDTAKALVHYAKMNCRIFALPSIIGTGSEQTSFAALYKDNGKISLDSPKLLPSRVLIDSELYRFAPIHVKNAPAIDCLCQAIESFWAKDATDISRIYALECMRLCSKFLRSYILSSDIESAVKMGKASVLSGKAINISKTTVSHALSYGLSLFYGIKHGQGVALTIPNLFEFNKNYILNMPEMLDALGLADVNDFKPWFQQLLLDVGLNISISNFSIHNFDVNKIVDTVNIQRLNNNPRAISRIQLASLFN